MELIEEGDALRTIMQYINSKTLGMWLQMYANPDMNFRYSKYEFWRRKRDENAHYCMPYPTQKIDIMESLDQIAKGMQGRNDTRDNNYTRSRNQYNNYTSNQYYQRLRNQYTDDNNYPSISANQSRNDYDRNITNRTNNYNNRPQYTPQYQSN